MLRLTREIRFALNADGSLPPDGRNGFGGRPALSGLGFHLALRVTLAGEVDPESGYLRNIVDVDREARTRAIPVLQAAVRERRFDELPTVALRLHAALRDVLPSWDLDAVELCLSPTLGYKILTSEVPMVRLSQKFEFSAAHRLHNPSLSDEQNRATFGKCNNPQGHGHNYEVQVTILGAPPNSSSGDSSPRFPTVHEFEALVDRHAIEPFDHKFLNHEIPEFMDGALNPSVENIAKVLYRRLKPHVRGLASVTVWETPKTWAEYGEERTKGEG